MPLALTSGQKLNIIDPIDADLEQVYAEGVTVSGVALLPAMTYYTDTEKFPVNSRTSVKDYARQLVAALVKRLGITGPFTAPAFQTGGLTTSVSYRKSDGVSNGTLTFTNGILTGSV